MADTINKDKAAVTAGKVAVTLAPALLQEWGHRRRREDSRGGSSGAGPILEKNAYVADRPTRQRKTLRGIRLPILFAGLIVLVAVVGGSVYLFAFGGLEEVQGFFAPPSASPTASPILGGLVTQAPTQVPTRQPTNNPTNQPITESPTNQPTNNPTNQPTTETPTTATGQPTTDQPTTDQPTTDQPTTSQPTTDQPTTDQPTTDQPTTSQPTTDQPTTDQPTTDQPTTSQPTTSQPTTFTGAPTPLPTTLRSPTRYEVILSSTYTLSYLSSERYILIRVFVVPIS